MTHTDRQRWRGGRTHIVSAAGAVPLVSDVYAVRGAGRPPDPLRQPRRGVICVVAAPAAAGGRSVSRGARSAPLRFSSDGRRKPRRTGVGSPPSGRVAADAASGAPGRPAPCHPSGHVERNGGPPRLIARAIRWAAKPAHSPPKQRKAARSTSACKATRTREPQTGPPDSPRSQKR